MPRSLAARLIVSLALVVPVALSAQTFVQKTNANVPSTLSLTLNPAGADPARLHYASGNRTFDAQAETMKATYTATGLTVEMSIGSLTSTDTAEPFQHKGQGTFKTLHLTFATNGDLTDVRPVK